MTLTFEGTGQSQQATIPWGPDVRGPYAVEQSLSRSPMKVGETRQIKMFIPELNKVCDVTLTAGAMEEVQLGEPAKRPLLRVEQKTSLEGKPRPEYDVTSWADSGGQVLKSYTPMMGGQTVYRTTKEAATTLARGGVQLDQIRSSIIKVKHKITSPESRRDVTYRVGLPGDDLTQVIPDDRRQTLRTKSDRTSGTLRVRSAGPEDGEPGPAQVDPEFLRPNAMVTSEDPKIVELARRAIERETDPWRRVAKIERWVFQNVKEKNFQTGFAPASEVARNLTGDCTEHGVLAAAMCRAVGIPSRVAIGLVYADQLGGFGYHLWTEVYVNRRWVAIDPSFDQTTVDAVHIKLSETSLAGVSPFEAFLPLVRVLSRLTLEPVEIN
jgi:transglutaminase-like putative cysteine protease